MVLFVIITASRICQTCVRCIHTSVRLDESTNITGISVQSYLVVTRPVRPGQVIKMNPKGEQGTEPFFFFFWPGAPPHQQQAPPDDV